MNDLEVMKHKMNILLDSLAGARGTLKTMMELVKGRTKQVLEAISVVASMVQGINERLARIEGRIEDSDVVNRWNELALLTLDSLGLGKGLLRTVGNEHYFFFPGSKSGYSYVQTQEEPEYWYVYVGTYLVKKVAWNHLRGWVKLNQDGPDFVPIRTLAAGFGVTGSSVGITGNIGRFTVELSSGKSEYIEVTYNTFFQTWRVNFVSPGRNSIGCDFERTTDAAVVRYFIDGILAEYR